MGQILKKDRVTVLMFGKFFVALIIFYIKPIYFKNHLHRRQGQSGFHFFIFIFNDEKEVQFFTFWDTNAQIFGAKKDTVFIFLLYSSWRVLRFYVGGLLSFIMSPMIAGERPWRDLYISIAKLWIFLWWIEKEPSFSRRVLNDDL